MSRCGTRFVDIRREADERRTREIARVVEASTTAPWRRPAEYGRLCGMSDGRARAACVMAVDRGLLRSIRLGHQKRYAPAAGGGQ